MEAINIEKEIYRLILFAIQKSQIFFHVLKSRDNEIAAQQTKQIMELIHKENL